MVGSSSKPSPLEAEVGGSMNVLQHEHPLKLIDLNPEYPHDEEVYDDDEELIMNLAFQSSCRICFKQINFVHRYYYKCDMCDYTLHKFCGEHTTHIIIYHPSHQHPLMAMFRTILAKCDACGKNHKGIYYQCTTCFRYLVHSDCVFEPKRVLIQDNVVGVFHKHPLTLTYSFPILHQQAKFNPRCRVCNCNFEDVNCWVYRCEKCRYYIHLRCDLSDGNAHGSKYTRGPDFIHRPDILNLPFPHQSDNILKHLFFKKNGPREFGGDDINLAHINHQHPLLLEDKPYDNIERPSASSRTTIISCHNSMKKAEVICDGCLRPIMSMPFYKCLYYEDQRCNFVLHEWCTRLPAELKNHPCHEQHTLVFMPKVPSKFLNVFSCAVCRLPCNGFAYSCVECGFYIDVCCGFIPKFIKHKSHRHTLGIYDFIWSESYCRMCFVDFEKASDPPNTFKSFVFTCISCQFHVHPLCAFLLPDTIRHKYDKHPMKLSYIPIEDHAGDYFCEVCETEFDPQRSFYHCDECGQSIHPACAPLNPQCKSTSYSYYENGIFEFINIKFGGIYTIEGHSRPLQLSLGTESDGKCAKCGSVLNDKLILKCLQCQLAFDCY